ncbi:MAG: cyclophilin-like fold protein [Candidatus Ranarchaeia archaeon]
MEKSSSTEEIKIVFKNLEDEFAEGILSRYKLPRVIENLTKKFPIKAKISFWQDSEIYFDIGINEGLPGNKATKEISIGDIAYWPVGKAFCVFYKKIKPYSAVGIIGKITKGIDNFRKLKRGIFIEIQKKG